MHKWKYILSDKSNAMPKTMVSEKKTQWQENVSVLAVITLLVWNIIINIKYNAFQMRRSICNLKLMYLFQ